MPAAWDCWEPAGRPEEGWWSDANAPFWPRIADLSDVAAGLSSGRQTEEETTLFINNVGMGLQFAAVGAKVYEAVRHEGLGHELPTEWFTESVHP